MTSCPLTLEITTISAGWIDVKIQFQNQEYEFPISTTWGTDTIFYLLGVLYYFSPDFVEACISEADTYIDEYKSPREYSTENYLFAYKAICRWCAEPSILDWYIERELVDEEDFNLKIRCESNFYDTEIKTIIDTVVPYKAFTYAVVKAIDDAIKCYGFMGFDESSHRCREFVMVHYLYLKALVLNRQDLIEIHHTGNRWEITSSLEKEFELIKLPM